MSASELVALEALLQNFNQLSSLKQKRQKDNINYTIKDDLAYTEDGVLVYNVFVCYIPKKTTVEETTKYFEKFGQLLKLKLLSDKKKNRRNAPKIAFVNYVNPNEAAKALQASPHFLNGRKIFTKACDSWHQPSSICSASNNIPDCMDVENTNTSIFELNDDCLELICKKLSLGDQLRFARVCGRFRDIFAISSKMQHKHFNLEDLEKLTLWECREFFRIVGPYIEKLSGTPPVNNGPRIMEFIAQFCAHAFAIHLNYKIKPNILSSLFRKMPQITELDLKNCSLHDISVMLMKKLPNLEKLSLAENYELTGQHLDKLATVKELNISSCANIQSSHFNAFCKSMDLKVLDVRRCERLNTQALQEMVNCKNLESLKISCSSMAEYECVAQLPKLVKLEVLNVVPNRPIRIELFRALAQHKAKQLEYLKVVSHDWMNVERALYICQITSLKHLFLSNNKTLTNECLRKMQNLENLEEITLAACPNITTEAVIGLLKSCHKLSRIGLQKNSNIKDNLVFSAIDVIKKRNELFKNEGIAIPKEPVLLYVSKTGIPNFILNDEKYLASTALLKVSFLRLKSAPEAGTPVVLLHNEMESDEEIFDDNNFLVFDSDMDDDDDLYDDVDDMDDFHLFVEDQMDDIDVEFAYGHYNPYEDFEDDINDIIF